MPNTMKRLILLSICLFIPLSSNAENDLRSQLFVKDDAGPTRIFLNCTRVFGDGSSGKLNVIVNDRTIVFISRAVGGWLNVSVYNRNTLLDDGTLSKDGKYRTDYNQWTLSIISKLKYEIKHKLASMPELNSTIILSENGSLVLPE